MLRPSVFCDLASRAAQPVQPAFRGAMASTSGAAGASASGRRALLDVWREGRRLVNLDVGSGSRNVGDRAFRRVARNGGIIADGRQPAGIDAFDGLSRR